MDYLELFESIEDIASTFGNLALFHNILGFILGIGLVVLAYIVYSFVFMYQGRKAGLDNDWFAYVPIARSIYRLDIVGEDRWKIFFIGGLATIIKIILVILLMLFAINTNAVIAVIFDIIILVYFGFCVYFTYFYNRKLYRLFNFNEHLSFVNLSADIASIYLLIALLGGLVSLYVFIGIYCVIASINTAYKNIFNFLTAFDNRCQTEVYATASSDNTIGRITPNRGQMECTAGMYRDAVFQIESDFEIIIGRDSYFSSIVINEGSKAISRKHCGIRYDKSNGDYIVTDYSSNGTYIAETGERLQRNTPQHLSRGTSFYLGDKNNRFRLM